MRRVAKQRLHHCLDVGFGLDRIFERTRNGADAALDTAGKKLREDIGP